MVFSFIFNTVYMAVGGGAGKCIMMTDQLLFSSNQSNFLHSLPPKCMPGGIIMAAESSKLKRDRRVFWFHRCTFVFCQNTCALCDMYSSSHISV